MSDLRGNGHGVMGNATSMATMLASACPEIPFGVTESGGVATARPPTLLSTALLWSVNWGVAWRVTDQGQLLRGNGHPF